MIGLVCALCLAVQDEGADPFDWARALENLDLSVGWGDFTAELHGDLDLELLVFGRESPGVSLEDPVLRADHYDRTSLPDSPQGVQRFSLTLEGGYQNWLSYSVEGRVDHGAPAEESEAVGVRLEQYWLRTSVPSSSLLSLQLGKFAAPIGNFIPRSLPSKNPFTTFPLMYDQVTTFMSKTDTPATILARKNRPAVKDWRVPIYREDYAVGGMISGTWEKLSYAYALMNSAPSTWPFQWPLYEGDFRHPNNYLHLSYALDPSLSLGASASRGPYDRQDAPGIPPGRDTADYPQTLAGVDVHYAIGMLDVFAEAYWSQYKAPLVDNLDLWAWYVEGKYTFIPGLFTAVRIAQMTFGNIQDAAGVSHPWDRTLYRWEWGGGYFFTRNFFLKLTLQFDRKSGGPEPNEHLYMLQMGLSF